MTDSDKKDLMAVYHQLKDSKKISPNLIDPSPGDIRDECLIIYREKHSPEDELILRTFLKKDKVIKGELTAAKLDIDKFRPLVTLLRQQKENPHVKHYILLAWLINFQTKKNRPLEGSGDEKTKQEDIPEEVLPVTENPEQFPECVDAATETHPEGPVKPIASPKLKILKNILLATFILLLGCGALYFYEQYTQGCIYWTGDHYAKSPCTVTKKGDTALIAFDEQKAFLKKIIRPDTITSRALGRVWYIKINHGIEYYTAAGFHPVDTRRKLKPITTYIIDKYIAAKKSNGPALTSH